MISKIPVGVALAAGAAMSFAVACATTPPSKSAPAAEPPEAPMAPAAASIPPMVHVPGGTFMMGAVDGMDNERPVHSVQIAPFDIDQHEVTVGGYAACVSAAVCTPAWTTVDGPHISDAQKEIRRHFCNANRPDRQDHPVNCVDSIQATTYCAWLGRRLPTEEEWEFAARGTDGRKFPWGNEPPSPKLLNGCGDECVAVLKQHGQAWTALYSGDDGFPLTASVGSYPGGKSPYGALDMAGNVSEWTASFGSRDYSKERENTYRIYRGGGWDAYGADSVRASHRGEAQPLERDYALGFRCAR